MKMYLVIGDWSDDGHGKTDKVLLEVNKEVREIQEAYKESCRQTGFSFNGNDDFTGLKRSWQEEQNHQFCTEYERNELSEEQVEFLREHGHDLKSEFDRGGDEGPYYVDSGTFVPLFMWFVGLSLPGLEWEKVKDEIPVINGYWDDNLNVPFGYGLYH